ncbi:hypothetical protein [Vulcanisaeta sp. JCM 16159]|uniref:hypothetical protein n=1 Tax=Vulcanisaeta sp. JCM 16159 TaxID=1295371 RepID=UPI0006D172D3|nr:hypothetical protein [Vulcanisaeta sp. JCM 16159]
MSNDEDERSKEILEIIRRAKDAGFIEEISISDVIEDVIKSTEEVNIILYMQSSAPILINAAKEEGYVSLALLDLNLTMNINLEEYPAIAQSFTNLEEITTRIGYELYGDRSIAPFLFPLKLNMNDKRATIICGIKAAITEDLFNENFIEGLIDNLELNYTEYFTSILNNIEVTKKGE